VFFSSPRDEDPTKIDPDKVSKARRYPWTGRGDVNTYALFAEQFMGLVNRVGRAGIIIPTGIATDATTAPFFGYIINNNLLRTLFDFRNKGFFEGVAQSQGVRFALITLGSPSKGEPPEFAFKLEAISELADARRKFILTPEDIARINPNTRNSPIFRTQFDAEITAKLHKRVPILIDDQAGKNGNQWGLSFLRMFDMAADSKSFFTSDKLEELGAIRIGSVWEKSDPAIGNKFLPLFEAKMVHQYNHRHGDYNLATIIQGKDVRQIPQAKLAADGMQNYEVTPRYWISSLLVADRLSSAKWEHEWLLGWRDITSSIDERTLIACLAPRVGFNDKFLLMIPSFSTELKASLYGCLNSIVCDYIARQKLGGTSFKYFVIKQLPILPPPAYSEADLAFIVPRVLELSYTSHSMSPFARDLGYDGPPFAWDEDRRAHLRAELDAWYALAYGLTRDELRYVLDPKDVMGADYPSETFRVLQKNEIAKHGEYRTRRLVLAAYDALTASAPETAALADGQWRGTISEEADVRLLLAAILKRMRQPRSSREVRAAFLYAAQPHLLMPHVNTTAQAEWQRLVGDAASLPVSQSVPTFSARQLAHFGTAQAMLAARNAWRYDAGADLVDRGAAIYDMVLPPWAEGRADFVWHALRSIDLSSPAVTTALSQGEQSFVAQSAAA